MTKFHAARQKYYKSIYTKFLKSNTFFDRSIGAFNISAKCDQFKRQYSKRVFLTEKESFKLDTSCCDYSLISLSKEFQESQYADSKDNIVIIPDFISEKENEFLTKQIEKKIRRYCRDGYALNHFDKNIDNYREFSCSGWLPVGRSLHSRSTGYDPRNHINQSLTASPSDLQVIEILEKVWSLFPKSWAWIAPHILDLNTGGNIRAHVDNADYSGLYVGGLSLLSSSVSTFRHISDPNIRCDIFLPPRSLYFFSHKIRYEFTHEITSNPSQRKWNDVVLPNQRRVSVMFRDANEENSLKSPSEKY